jgi:DNA-directed RNA polymerase subunit beta
MIRNEKDGGKETQTDSTVEIYSLRKFQRSNQNTCINQKPIVSVGMKVKKGDVIADGPATDMGELSLGRNVLVAFMSWKGYNFEDAIVVSEKLVKEDTFTSVHIEEFQVEARDTKQGKEEITRDIPNIGEESLKDLDESGIIRIGAKVKPDDILVGKITPKGETQLSPEEKLLKAIFGEKAGDVKDTSLRVSPGIEGTVVEVKVFSRKGVDKDSRSLTIEEEKIKRIEKDYSDEIKIVKEERNNKIKTLLCGKTAANQVISSKSEKVIIQKKKKITEEMLSSLKDDELLRINVLQSESVQDEINEVHEVAKDQIHALKTVMNENIAKLRKGDELPPGVIKLVKVSIAMKRKLSIGDKIAGRHGNKGIVSIIVPEENMPFMEDGTRVDIVLNPLGVPSRMNLGQILETNLGLAAKKLGIHMATPVFDGASEEDIGKLLEKANYPRAGKVQLYDGETGEPFDQKVLIGQIYILKLHHLVDDKIHSRSTGPYSLVTQQPLGGKAQFGGQRLGEMEVWALEAYGVANVLQEMLTVKSDDVEGRKRMYESIVKGRDTMQPSLPESFNVMVKELQSLGIDVELIEEKDSK